MLLFCAVCSSVPLVPRNFARKSWTSPSLTVTCFAAAASLSDGRLRSAWSGPPARRRTSDRCRHRAGTGQVRLGRGLNLGHRDAGMADGRGRAGVHRPARGHGDECCQRRRKAAAALAVVRGTLVLPAMVSPLSRAAGRAATPGAAGTQPAVWPRDVRQRNGRNKQKARGQGTLDARACALVPAVARTSSLNPSDACARRP